VLTRRDSPDRLIGDSVYFNNMNDTESALTGTFLNTLKSTSRFRKKNKIGLGYSLDLYDNSGKNTDIEDLKRGAFDEIEQRLFIEEMQSLAKKKERIYNVSALSINKKLMSMEHHGQKMFFNLVLDEHEEYIKINISDCHNYFENKEMEEHKLKEIFKSLQMSGDHALAVSKESRLELKKKFSELYKSRFIKLNHPRYDYNKLLCLIDILKDMHMKYLRLGITQNTLFTKTLIAKEPYHRPFSKTFFRLVMKGDMKAGDYLAKDPYLIFEYTNVDSCDEALADRLPHLLQERL